MTVPSELSRVQYTTDGVSVTFPVPFRFLANDHLRVTRRTENGTLIFTLDLDYTVSGAGNPSGGTVTTTGPVRPGATLVIERIVPITQETAYQRNDPFPERAHEQALDKLTMIDQMFGSMFGLTPGSQRRVLLLGEADLDGWGAYRANHNRIQDVGEPILATDAARMQDVLKALADLATDGSGQFVVERLSDTSDPANGAGMVGRSAVAVESVAALLITTEDARRADQRYLVRAYHANTEVGGGPFRWDPDSIETPNGVTVLAVHGVAIGRFKRILERALRPEDAGAWGNGLADDTDALERSLSGRAIVAEQGTYKLTDSVAAPQGARIQAIAAIIAGDGDDAFLVTGDVDISGLGFDGVGAGVALAGDGPHRARMRHVRMFDSAGHVIKSDMANEVDIHFHVDGAESYNSRGLVDIAGALALAGTVANGYVGGGDRLGVRLGWNSRPLAWGWGPVSVINTVVKDIVQDDAFSCYGIISYSPYSRIIGNHIEHIYNAGTGGDTEGIYTKAPYSVLIGNVMKNAGQTEGSMNIKGVSKTGPGTGPYGYSVVAVGNVFQCTEEYRAKVPSATGVKINVQNVIFSNALFEGHNGKALDTAGGQPLHSLKISTILIQDHRGDNPAVTPAVALSSSDATNCTVTDVTVTDCINVPAVAVVGGDNEVDYLISTFALRNIYHGFRIGTQGNTTLIIRNGKIVGALNAAIAGAGSIMLKRLILEDVYLEDCAAFFSSNRLVKHFDMKNVLWTGTQTTDASATSVIATPVARDGVTLYEVTVKASDGTDQMLYRYRELWSNAAGSISRIGDREDLYEYKSAGASSWAIPSASTITNGISLRVQGEAGKTINWEFELNATSA